MYTILLNNRLYPGEIKPDPQCYIDLYEKSALFRSLMLQLKLDRSYLLSTEFKNTKILEVQQLSQTKKILAEAKSLTFSAAIENVGITFEDLSMQNVLMDSEDIILQYIYIDSFFAAHVKGLDFIPYLADLRNNMFGFDQIYDAGEVFLVHANSKTEITNAMQTKINDIQAAVNIGKRIFLFTTSGNVPIFNVLVVRDSETAIAYEEQYSCLHVGNLEQVLLMMLYPCCKNQEGSFTISSTSYSNRNYPALQIAYDCDFKLTKSALSKHDMSTVVCKPLV